MGALYIVTSCKKSSRIRNSRSKMKISILLLSLLVVLAVLSCAESSEEEEETSAGSVQGQQLKKCNITGKKCRVCDAGFKPKQRGKKCKPKPCNPGPCENGGKCNWNKKKKKEVCKCPKGTSGDKCEITGCSNCVIPKCTTCTLNCKRCKVCKEGTRRAWRRNKCLGKNEEDPDCPKGVCPAYDPPEDDEEEMPVVDPVEPPPPSSGAPQPCNVMNCAECGAGKRASKLCKTCKDGFKLSGNKK